MENNQPNSFSFGKKAKKPFLAEIEAVRKGFYDPTSKEESKVEQLQQYQVSLRKNVREKNFSLKRAERTKDEEQEFSEEYIQKCKQEIEFWIEKLEKGENIDEILEAVHQIRQAITMKNGMLIAIIIERKFLGFAMKYLFQYQNNQIAFELLWSICNLAAIDEGIGRLLIELGFHIIICEIMCNDTIDSRIIKSAIEWTRNLTYSKIFFDEVCEDRRQKLNKEHGIESLWFENNRIIPIEFIDCISKLIILSQEADVKIKWLIWIFQINKSIKEINSPIWLKVIRTIQEIINSTEDTNIIRSWYKVLIGYIKNHQLFVKEILNHSIFHGNWRELSSNDYILKLKTQNLEILDIKLEFIQWLIINGKIELDTLKKICIELNNVVLDAVESIDLKFMTIIALLSQKINESPNNKNILEKLGIRMLIPKILSNHRTICLFQNIFVIILNIFQSKSISLISDLYKYNAIDIWADGILLKDQKVINLSLRCLSSLISYSENADIKIVDLNKVGYTDDEIISSDYLPYFIIKSKNDTIRDIESKWGDRIYDIAHNNPEENIKKIASSIVKEIEKVRDEDLIEKEII